MSFDAFSNTDDFREDVYFGEICVYRGFKAIWLYDIDNTLKGWQEYEPENELHKKALATLTKNGKQRNTSIAFEVQHFPQDVNFETFMQTWTTWSDGWKMFENSLAETLGIDISTRNKLGDFRNVHLRKLSEQGNYFKYETPVIRKYTNANGEEKSIRGIRILQKFNSFEEMQKAHQANEGKLPEDSKMDEPAVEAIPREQALQFVATLAKQIADTPDCWKELQVKIDEMPMLGKLSVEDDDVKKAAEKASQVFATVF
jgi:hypothetical protein